MHVVVIGGFAPSLTKFRGPLLAALVARGHRVTALAADGTPAITAELAGLGVAFEPLAVERAGLDPRADLRTLVALVAQLRRLRPDLVLGYTIKPVIYGSLAARIARVPRRAAMITGLGYSFTHATTPGRRAVASVARALYRIALAGCDTVLFQNPDDRADFGRWGLLRGAGQRVEVVRGSGVDVAHYARAPLPSVAGGVRFVYVGRFLGAKGFRDYVEMARRVRARHPTAVFGAVGWVDANPDSVSRAELDAWAASGVVEDLGALDDVRPAIAAAHVLVLPSYREGTPRTVLEAMSLGRAVITTDAPGCRETIVDGDSGLAVPVGDPAALAAAAEQLIAHPARIAELAARARERVERLYDARRVAEHVLDVLGV